MIDQKTLHVCTESKPSLSKSLNNGVSKRILLPTARQSRLLLANDDIVDFPSVRVQNTLRELERKNIGLAKEKDEAIMSIKILHRQQQNLYDSFKLLREKYDDQKSELHHVLWEFIPTQKIEDIGGYSELGEVNHAVFESHDRISNYTIGEVIGEGQFSDVKLCTHCITGNKYAMKIIQKQKISSLSGLKHVCTEIKLLRQLQHPNVVTFVDYIHSPLALYMLTEIGGRDLFEFFDANPLGTDEKLAKHIILGIAKPLVYLHACGICHRDLKPENILLTKVGVGEEVTHENVRICDFGQSAIGATNGMTLSGLCGSPGFFAPEMIIGGGEYSGFAADVWSVGCIMLELTRGHDEFCRHWMTSYDYDILQEEHKFEEALREAVSKIEQRVDNCKKNEEMNAFQKNLIKINPDLRYGASEMLKDSWLQISPTDSAELENMEKKEVCGDSAEPSKSSMDINPDSLESSRSEETKSLRGKRSMFRNSFSSRARKHFAGTNKKGDKVILNDDIHLSSIDVKKGDEEKRLKDHIEIRLPPIEPETPSFRTARRTIIESDKIVKHFEEQDGIKSAVNEQTD
jgi:serine/threonine protein kinase